MFQRRVLQGAFVARCSVLSFKTSLPCLGRVASCCLGLRLGAPFETYLLGRYLVSVSTHAVAPGISVLDVAGCAAPTPALGTAPLHQVGRSRLT
jgi:hypothetical protein